jgi:DNA-binding transcriptional ArsR family regulator
MTYFSALADPTRQRIFELVAKGEKSSGEIASAFPFKAPTISQHLKVLKEAKLVRVRAEKQKRFYSVDQQGFEELEAWVLRTKHFWGKRLDALERALAQEELPPSASEKEKS